MREFVIVFISILMSSLVSFWLGWRAGIIRSIKVIQKEIEDAKKNYHN